MAGKEVVMLTVDYAPGESSPAHTHDAQAMVYVLEGAIRVAAVVGLAGQPSILLKKSAPAPVSAAAE